MDDAAEFASVLECMISLGFSKEERDTIFKIIAAVLHLGEAQFTHCVREGQDGISVADDACLHGSEAKLIIYSSLCHINYPSAEFD